MAVNKWGDMRLVMKGKGGLSGNISGIILFCFIGLTPIIWINYVLKTGVLMGVIINIILFFIWFLPIVGLLFYGFYNTPNKLIIENEMFIAEKFLFKDILIPMKNITKIEKNYVFARGGGGYVYMIYYDKKELRVRQGIYSYNETEFDKFMCELVLRVEKAKKTNRTSDL